MFFKIFQDIYDAKNFLKKVTDTHQGIKKFNSQNTLLCGRFLKNP